MEISKVKQIYNEIDREISKEKKACYKGCSACCYQQIEIMNFEKEAIRTYVSDNIKGDLLVKVKQGLNEWLDFFDKNTLNDKPLDGKEIFEIFNRTAAIKGLRCPFLINDICSIYEMRPLTCRIHYVEDNPKLCETNRLRDSAPKAYMMRANMMQIMKNLGEVTLEPLTYIVSDIIIPSRKLKKIERIVLP